MKLAIGGDHAGFHLKAELIDHLKKAGHEIVDVGCHSAEPVDFPDIAESVGAAVRSGAAERGLVVCGTGVGAAIACNKMHGIRAAVCHDVHSSHQAVEHDDVNVMCLGAQIVGPRLARDLVEAFLRARFNATEDHVRRVAKLSRIELPEE
jgi:ribose 5-phosphate isomerase B